VPAKQLLEILSLKRRIRQGGHVSLGNVAILYRDMGNHRRAFKWWRKAAAAGDGDAWVDIGYCLQYGIGVRPSASEARHAFEKAIQADLITEYGQEEARYHLALLHLDTKGTAGAGRAATLLAEASHDGDYAEAVALLSNVASEPTQACRCRRGLRRRIKGQVECPKHAVPGRRPHRRASGPTKG
jgi:tetratricopeptide (TPR) repeat protein